MKLLSIKERGIFYCTLLACFLFLANTEAEGIPLSPNPNNGLIEITAGGDWNSIEFNNNSTGTILAENGDTLTNYNILNNQGTISFHTVANFYNTGPNALLTNDGTVTFQTATSLWNIDRATIKNTYQFTNTGVAANVDNAGVSVLFTNDGSDALLRNSDRAVFSNYNGATLQNINNATLLNESARLSNSATIQNYGNASLSNFNQGLIINSNGGWIANSAKIYNSTSGTELRNEGIETQLTNSGEAALLQNYNEGLLVNQNGSLLYNGQGATLLNENATLRNIEATMENYGPNSFFYNIQGGTFTNSGLTAEFVNNNATFRNNNAYIYNQRGATIRNWFGDIINDNGYLINSGVDGAGNRPMFMNQTGATLTNTNGATLDNYAGGTFYNEGGTLNNEAGSTLLNRDYAIFVNRGESSRVWNQAGATLINSGDNTFMYNQLGGLMDSMGIGTTLRNENGAHFTNENTGTRLSNLNYATLINTGQDSVIENRNGAWLNNAGSGASLINENQAHLINTGAGTTLTNSVSATLINSNATITNADGASLINDAEILNQSHGFFIVDENSAVTGSGLYRQEGIDSETIVDGLLEQGRLEFYEGALKGNGTVTSLDVPLYLGENAWIEPGSSVGSLTIDSDFLCDGGWLYIEIGLDVVDQLEITGTTTFLSGGIQFIFADDFIPSPDALRFMIADDIIGLDNLALNFLNLPTGLDYGLTYSGDFLMLVNNTSEPVPEPATMLLIGFGLMGLAVVRRRFRE